MPGIVSAGTSDAPHAYSQTELKKLAHELFLKKGRDFGRLLDVFDNSLIDSRHFINSSGWFESPKSFKERSISYIENVAGLSIPAIRACVESAGADYGDFDHIIVVTSTGVSAPSADALILNRLGLDRHVKRTPVWGLGCAGGAAGMSRAFEYAKAFPESAVLLVAAEMCSLAFHGDDYSKSNVVSLALFSDGAAAVLVAGEKHRLYGKAKVRMTGSLSTTWPDTLGIMGWEIVDDGLRAIFSKEIPNIVKSRVRENIDELLGPRGLSASRLGHFAVHPGGPKVLSEYEAALGLEEGAFRYSRKVLREHGNMSSPTVLYVLKEVLDGEDFGEKEYGIISALGPGFSSELVLFESA
ncbi:MAG: type III polyketide synthase [Candidatus Dadabacteria bacterium]|nr:type III polyketide synthase [Candidatus Dadabacteria bacterium]